MRAIETMLPLTFFLKISWPKFDQIAPHFLIHIIYITTYSVNPFMQKFFQTIFKELMRLIFQ